MKKLIISLFVVILLVAVTAVIFLNSNDNHYSMRQAYGSWYGFHEDERGIHTAFYRLNENGTFEIAFASYVNTCVLRSKSTIMGVWGLDGPVFFMITQKQKFKGITESRNPNNPGFYSAFKVLKLDEVNFIFAREKPWLSRYLRFSRFRIFYAFGTKGALKKFFEREIGEMWSSCSNITTFKDLD